MTQRALAELINVHVIQVRRYENGASQPTLDPVRRLAVALQVSADVLIFGKDERGPDGLGGFNFVIEEWPVLLFLHRFEFA